MFRAARQAHTTQQAPSEAAMNKGHTMITTHTLVRIVAGALLSGGLAAVSLGLAAGTAQAQEGPFTWCPGQPRNTHNPGPNGGPGSPGPAIEWDWSVCHTWWIVGWGQGNVGGPDRSIWDGDNPPAVPPPCFGLPCGLFP